MSSNYINTKIAAIANASAALFLGIVLFMVATEARRRDEDVSQQLIRSNFGIVSALESKNMDEVATYDPTSVSDCGGMRWEQVTAVRKAMLKAILVKENKQASHSKRKDKRSTAKPSMAFEALTSAVNDLQEKLMAFNRENIRLNKDISRFKEVEKQNVKSLVFFEKRLNMMEKEVERHRAPINRWILQEEKAAATRAAGDVKDAQRRAANKARADAHVVWCNTGHNANLIGNRGYQCGEYQQALRFTQTQGCPECLKNWQENFPL